MNNKNIIVQFIMFFVVIIFAFFLLLKFNVISFDSNTLIDGVVLNHHNIGLKVGNSYQLSLDVIGNKYSKNISWTSSDESIATVSKNGKVTAHKEGEVTITSSVLNNNYFDQCRIVVSNNDVLISDVNIKTSKINLAIGSKYNLIYDIYPYYANLHNILFTSSDESVVDVSNDGVITGKRKGQAIIYVSANNGMVTDEVLVEVFSDNNGKLPIKDEININVGALYSFYNLSENNKLSWSSLDENFATVNENGIVYGKKIGNTKILVTTLNGNKKIINVNVANEIIPVENISFDNLSVLLEIGKESNVNVLIEPSNATNQTLIWKSSNEKVLTVNEYGKINAISEGKAVLKVTSADGKHYDEITINVEKPKDIIIPKDIIVPFEELHLYVNDTINIPISVSPSNSTFKNVDVNSTDPKIISFNDGLLRAHSKGESSLIVTTNNNIKKEIKVNVDEVLATGISLNKYDVSLKKNESMIIIPNIVPINTTFKNIKWSSSDQSIVMVSSDGVIKAKSLGKALITATNINSNIETKLIVNVIE